MDEPADHDPPRTPLPSRPGTETILLAEDDAAVRRLVRTVLEDAGYTVLEAADGERALDAARAWGGDLHLLLTDVVMPRMRGVELAARLRAARPGLRVLYMSGYAEEAFRRDTHGRLGDDLLQKPVDPDDLLRRVRQLLDRG